MKALGVEYGDILPTGNQAQPSHETDADLFGLASDTSQSQENGTSAPSNGVQELDIFSGLQVSSPMSDVDQPMATTTSAQTQAKPASASQFSFLSSPPTQPASSGSTTEASGQPTAVSGTQSSTNGLDELFGAASLSTPALVMQSQQATQPRPMGQPAMQGMAAPNMPVHPVQMPMPMAPMVGMPPSTMSNMPMQGYGMYYSAPGVQSVPMMMMPYQQSAQMMPQRIPSQVSAPAQSLPSPVSPAEPDVFDFVDASLQAKRK